MSSDTFRPLSILKYQEKHCGDVVGALVKRQADRELPFSGVVDLGVDMVGAVCVQIGAPIPSLAAIPGELHRFEAIGSEPAIEILFQFEDRFVDLLGLALQGTVIATFAVEHSRIKPEGSLGHIGVY